ncbi:MAG: CO dehydrogenase/acetyl-CoA synthase subunit delta [Candidatus Hydrothermarchaeales archaeon]
MKGKKVWDLLSSLDDFDALELEDVQIDAEELVFKLRKSLMPRAEIRPPIPTKIKREPIVFEKPIKEYRGEIAEVQLGATKAEGGSRGKVIKIGGQTTLYRFEGGVKNRPVITFDTFDISQPQFPKVQREAWSNVWDAPAEWAKKAVKLGADLVTIHLVSTDPKIKDTTPRDAAKTVEEVLQAVDVPLVIGGSGNPEKDPLVLEKAAEVAEGERCLLASANLDLDYKRIVEAAKRYNHNVLSWVSLDINDQRMLNKLILDLGLPKEQMVLDPTTAALGYGIEYTFTMIERVKQNALKGDEELQMPISCGATNAWGARESWMNVPEWGAREYRGPLWEAVTALTVLMAGADMMMMLNPRAASIVKDVILRMFDKKKAKKEIKYEDWLKV